MAGEKILIVEDEPDVVEVVRYNLARDGYRIESAGSGREGLEKARREKPDLVVLDLMLPEIDGLEVCRILKAEAETSHIPVLMLTARGEESDIVAGLELGADDYITKPFSPRVLTARVKAVLRRKRAAAADEQNEVLRIGELEIDRGKHRVLYGGTAIDLTSSEFSALRFLASRPGRVYTRYQIVDAVHGADYPVTDRSVDVLIVGLRKKLGEAGECIETVRGVGYRFREKD